MNQLQLVANLFLYPSPAGAYQAVSSEEGDSIQRFLKRLLQEEVSPEMSISELQRLMSIADPDKALQQLLYCQKLGWVQGLEKPLEAPQGALEEILPSLLEKTAENGKVLLADEQGFCLVRSGFTHEVAEELSALSAELATVQKRRSGLLLNHFGIASQAWAIVDAYGNSQIGCWPLFIGEHRFVLAISGVPHFNKAEFVTLVWALAVRYVKHSLKILETER